MTSGQLAFECLLLSRMKQPYRTSVLRANGLTDPEVMALASASEVGYPDLLRCPLERFRHVFGDVAPDLLEMGEDVTHAFPLRLWPHMHWLVHVDGAGRTAGIEFSPVAVHRWPVAPETMTPGNWTLGELRQMAERFELVDGWDEQVVMRGVFDGQAFEGEFVFGLMQSWRRDSSRAVSHSPG